jgi:hypothetical protein
MDAGRESVVQLMAGVAPEETKKLRRLGELLQVPLSLCVVLPYYAIAVALFTLFLLIPSLIANVLVDAWKKRVVGSQSFGQ